MEITEILELNGEAFAKEVFASNFEVKYKVWCHLREKMESCDKTIYFTKHLLPLLKPTINRYKYKLPIQEWEDFEQDVALDLFLRISDYNPGYNDGKYLGNVFFQHVVHNTFKHYMKKLNKENALKDALEKNGQANACVSCAEDTVLFTMQLNEAFTLYKQMCKKYKSPYYARQKTQKTLETLGLCNMSLKRYE